MTGSSLIDSELNEMIELLLHDFIESWYKTNISSRNDFCKDVRLNLHNVIRYLTQCMKNIDWETFILNTLSNNFVLHMRIYKKAKEKLKIEKQNGTNTINTSTMNSASPNTITNDETNLVELFFDIEADTEKGICRDEISHNSNGKEQEYLQELCELMSYLLLQAPEFNCLTFRCLIREVLSHYVIKDLIDLFADPDYINQTMLWLLNSQPILIENFILTINYNESLDELNEINVKIDEDISRTRSKDKGGENDHEVKLQLSSLQYLKRRIEQNITNLKANNFQLLASAINSTNIDDEIKQFVNNQYSVDFDTVLTNEAIQHCFIEYMGTRNAHNLISFYLNAQIYPKFAKSELESERMDKKLAVLDFGKGLITSYLMQNVPEEDLTNVSNIIYYRDELNRTLERMKDVNLINEHLLHDLQLKIYLLMKQKYYPEFKQSIEFQKLVSKNDFLKNLINSSTSPYEDFSDSYAAAGESVFASSSSSHNSPSIDDSDRISQLSFDIENHYNHSTAISNSNPADFNIMAVITSCGKCNELKERYAIYIIDVKKIFDNAGKNEYWQTYRRFNDFHDLHLTIKKRFPTLSNLVLPGKSLRSSLSEEFLEKRRSELNRYLKTLCHPSVIVNNPGLLQLLLKFLENRRWDNSQTNFTRKFDSFLTPVLSSVQNIQTTIKNAPDNVLGMVKGISDNIITNTVESINKIRPTTSTPSSVVNESNNNNNNSSNINGNSNNTNNLDKDLMIDDSSGNFSLKVLLVLMDEIFDLKEKNQWLRQSLVAIIKGFLKNFKGDSMNRKIRGYIADYISEESLARYLKRIRKRLWPKGVLADPQVPRSKAEKDITRMLVKTKLLALVSDELKTMLSGDTTRRGLFSLFDMLQHKALNKRLVHVLIESFLTTLFQSNYPSKAANQSGSGVLNLNSPITPSALSNKTTQTQIQTYIRNYLTKSQRVRPEWRQAYLSQINNLTMTTMNPLSVKSNSSFSTPPTVITTTNSSSSSSSSSSLPRSKSVQNYVQC